MTEVRNQMSEIRKNIALARLFLALCCSGALLFAFLFSAWAQQSGKIPRIAYLTNDSLSIDLPRRDAFRRGLRDFGYNEGQNIVVEYRTSESKIERLPELATELARLKPDLVFAFSTAAAQTAKKEIPNVPIVAVTPDPITAGLVASLGRPGGNITGLSMLAGTEIYGKYLELLKETISKLTHVGILWNPDSPFNSLALKETESTARAFRLSLQSLEARTPAELETAFATATKEHTGALVVVQDAMFVGQRAQIANLAAKSRLPAIYGITEHAEAGGLMAYAASRPDIFRRAATYVDKILKGAKPADLPVEQPTKFELVINLKAAKQIGLTIPPNVLARANKVIR
jgi:putative ABC transport system substrate-binding protein